MRPHPHIIIREPNRSPSNDNRPHRRHTEKVTDAPVWTNADARTSQSIPLDGSPQLCRRATPDTSAVAHAIHASHPTFGSSARATQAPRPAFSFSWPFADHNSSGSHACFPARDAKRRLAPRKRPAVVGLYFQRSLSNDTLHEGPP